MSLVALVNTTNHLFVRIEPLILTPRTNCEHVLGPWSRWLTQQTTYLYAENHLFQHREPIVNMSLVALVNTTNYLFVRIEPLISTPRTNCEHVLGRVG